MRPGSNGSPQGEGQGHCDPGLATAREWISGLATEIGPRRPTGAAERAAAEFATRTLRGAGVPARIEPFAGYASFGYPFALIQALCALPAVLRGRRRRSAAALAGAGLLAAEGSLRVAPVSRIMARGDSQNVVGTIEPTGPVARTLVLSAHLDSSRSGLIFDPRYVDHLGTVIAAQSIAGLAQAGVELLAGGTRLGRGLANLLRIPPAIGLLLLAEREMRGEDVAGANDNASGCAVVGALAAELAAEPPESTRVEILLTGCEESGTLGSQAFIDRHGLGDRLFLNFDNVGGPDAVRYLTREGVIAKFDADPGMIAAADGVAASEPQLRFRAEPDPAGLTYDTSPVLARGGRGLTISVQEGSIPDLHWPTDTEERISWDGVSRTIAAGRALVAAIDRGAAD